MQGQNIKYKRKNVERKMIKSELCKLGIMNDDADYFMKIYNSSKPEMEVNPNHKMCRLLVKWFMCSCYDRKIIIKKQKMYGCNERCKNCVMCLYGYIIETPKEVLDPNHVRINTSNMRKDLLCLPLVSMILVRFKVPKDIRKYIYAFLGHPHKKLIY